MTRFCIGLASIVAASSLVACSDDDASTRFAVAIENTSPVPDHPASGAFDTPLGASTPRPLMPGEAYEMRFEAAPGYPARVGATRLSFATMFVPSNDLFFAPSEEGIRLFDDAGAPRTGDITSEIAIWDAGTEIDQPLGGPASVSPDQAPNQGMTAMKVGALDPRREVRLASETYSVLPDVSDVVRATLRSEIVDRVHVFTLRLENVSIPGTLRSDGPTGGAVPLSPGVFVVHVAEDGAAGPLFTTGTTDRSEGLERIAEDGSATQLGATLEARTGIRFVSSPGVFVVHEGPNPIFELGAQDRGEGLEALAEDGETAALAAALRARPDVAEVGVISAEGPVGPGEVRTFEVSVRPDQRLSLVTMVVPSNDYLFATAPEGVDLFAGGGIPLRVLDAGTESDQPLGVGLDQVHLQPAPNTGAPDPDPIVSDLGLVEVAMSLTATATRSAQQDED